MNGDPIEERAHALLAELAKAPPEERERRRPEVRELAQRTKRAGVDLCYSRATEQSPRIGVLFLAAAKLARVGWDDAERPEHFERDLRLNPDSQAELERFTAGLARGPRG